MSLLFIPNTLPYLLKCKTKVFFFPYIWHLNMGGCIKFSYEAPNQVALKQTVRSQTMACITELSREFCALLRCCAEKSDNSLPAFWDNVMVPSSKSQEIPENRA